MECTLQGGVECALHGICMNTSECVVLQWQQPGISQKVPQGRGMCVRLGSLSHMYVHPMVILLHRLHSVAFSVRWRRKYDDEMFENCRRTSKTTRSSLRPSRKLSMKRNWRRMAGMYGSKHVMRAQWVWCASMIIYIDEYSKMCQNLGLFVCLSIDTATPTLRTQIFCSHRVVFCFNVTTPTSHQNVTNSHSFIADM